MKTIFLGTVSLIFVLTRCKEKPKEENHKIHLAKWKTSDFVVFVKMNNKSLVSLWTSCLDSTNKRRPSGGKRYTMYKIAVNMLLTFSCG